LKKLVFVALGLAATGSVVVLRTVSMLMRKRKEKSEYDAEVNTWEGEGGSVAPKARNEVGVLLSAHEPERTAPAL
jgi:hypothetical protein